MDENLFQFEFPGCSTSRRHKGISIFRLPSKKKVELVEWRSQLERLILKDRVIDKNLKNQAEKGNLHICEKHFKKDDIDSSEYVLFTSGQVKFFSLEIYDFQILSKLNFDDNNHIDKDLNYISTRIKFQSRAFYT